MRQRWGTFSVIDHKDPAQLAVEVLLYDKLVIPVPVTNADQDRWKTRGWDPKLQEFRLQMLGDLAYRANWGYRDSDSAIHLWAQQFAYLENDIADIVKEARQNLGYHLTRQVLAQQKYPLPRGVEKIDLIVAYQSEKTFRLDFRLETVSNDRADLALKLGQRIAVPLLEGDQEHAFISSVELARDQEYRSKRTAVYALQDQILSDSQPVMETVQELEQRTEELIAYVKLMTKKVSFTFAFALVGVHPGHLAGRPLPRFASKSTTLSAVQFRPHSPAFTRPSGSPARTTIYHD